MKKLKLIQQAMERTGSGKSHLNQLKPIETAEVMFNLIDIMEEDVKVQELINIKQQNSDDFIADVGKRSFIGYSTEDLIDCLPENQPLYKDSGLWQIRTDDMENVMMYQHASETLRNFILRFYDWLDEHNQTDIVWVDLCCKNLNS